MKKFFFTFLSTTFIFALFLSSFLFVNLSQIKPAYAAACVFSPIRIDAGDNLGIIPNGFTTSTIPVKLVGTVFGNVISVGSIPQAGGSVTIPIGTAGVYEVKLGPTGADITCTTGNLTVIAPIGGSPPPGIGAGNIGTINPGTLPTAGGDPSALVAGIIKAGISLLILVAFIVDLIWTIIAGIRFITAGGDPKSVGQAWSQIYWGLIGMVVVLGSFAIIKLVETFFGVNIISGGITLPTI